MSAKISALPSAVANDITDVLPIVQGGVNKQTTRTAFFTGPAGQAITFFQGTTGFQIDAAGNFQLAMTPGCWFNIQGANVAEIEIDALGNISLNSAVAAYLEIGSNGGAITINAAGAIIIQPLAGQNCFVAYTPLSSGDWAFDPTSVWEALDRIAGFLAATAGSPIP